MTQTKRLPPAMTDMQQRFIENWAKSNFAESEKIRAYEDAGYASKCNVSTTLKSPRLNMVVRKIMKKKGLTLSKLVDKHNELLDAWKFGMDGRTPEPDNGVQLRALQEAYKIHDAYPVPIQKIAVAKQEEVHITLEDQRQAEQVLQECVDAEIIEEDGAIEEASDPEDAADRPL